MSKAHTESQMKLLNHYNKLINDYKSKNLEPTDKLDLVLFIIKYYEICNDGAFPSTIFNHLSPVINQQERVIILSEIEINKIIEVLWTKELLSRDASNTKYTVSFKGDLFIEDGSFKSEKRNELLKKIFKGAEIFVLVMASLATAWFAGLSYYESVEKDNLEDEKKSLLKKEATKDSLLKIKENQVLMYQDSEKILLKEIDSLSKKK